MKSYVWKWFESYAQGGFAQRNEANIVVTVKCPRLKEMAYKDIENSSGGNRYILLILTIGMSYY